MRLFVAVEVSGGWRDAARAVRAAVDGRQAGLPLRWVDPALMHLTLRFLGEVDEHALEPLQRELAAGVSPVDVQLALGPAGTFGAPGRTTVAWLEVGGDGEGLRALAERVEAAVVAAGLPSEDRPLHPHVTLARVRRGASTRQRRAVAEVIAALEPPVAAGFRARSVALVRSHLGREGPRYETLSRHA